MDFNVEYVETSSGRKALVVSLDDDNFLYYFKRTNDDKSINWRCSKSTAAKCHATITTDEDGPGKLNGIIKSNIAFGEIIESHRQKHAPMTKVDIKFTIQ